MYFNDENKIDISFITYGIAYGVFRFFVEIIRADSRGRLLGINVFSPSQIISILLIGFCILLFLRLKRQIITQPNNVYTK
ncbi:MAG: prolipoprotein diacylglyceryl transferase [Chloroflexia bacterium]|nr:prolipoprotein diacylglyceryl transferase [Chloroflexia bacterium]